MSYIYPILGAQRCLPFYLSGVGIAEPEYHVHREEGLVSHQFLYTKDGKGKLIVEGNEYLLSPGTMFYIAPGIPHEYYPVKDGEWTTCWLVFRGEQLSDIMQSLGFGVFLCEADVVNEEIRKLFRQMLSAAKDYLFGDERCSLLVYEYIMAVRKAVLQKRKKGMDVIGGILEKPLIYINEHYDQDITLEQLAELGGVTKQHFCRVFREKLKMRPMEYLARKRISVARGLLLSTQLSVAEIGKQVGYESITYFGMVFKKYEGISPTDCRKRRGTKQIW